LDEEIRLTFFRLCGHALAFFRSFEEALDPGTHTVSPKASNPFTISPITQRREETAAVIYRHLRSVRFEIQAVALPATGAVAEFVRPQRSQDGDCRQSLTAP
jgi:hypothetical protein